MTDIAWDRQIHDCTQAIWSGQFSGENRPRAFYNRGIAYQIIHQYELAIADFNQAIHLDPANAAAYYVRGLVKLKKGDTAGGIGDIARARQLNPAIN